MQHKISMSQFREKLITDVRTNERTDMDQFIGPSSTVKPKMVDSKNLHLYK